MKQGIGTLMLCTLLPVQTLAAGIDLSFDQAGTAAAVQLQDMGTDRYAAEITLPLLNMQGVQFQSYADSYAVTIDSVEKTVTLYVASRTPLTGSNGMLNIGTLLVDEKTEITGVGHTVVLDQFLNRYTYPEIGITVSYGGDDDSSTGDGSTGDDSTGGDSTGSGSTDDGSTGDGSTGGDSTGGGSTGNGSTGDDSSTGGSSTGGTGGSTNRTPTVSTDGVGGKVQAASDGSVTITPDAGYRIAKILVNGKEVAITTKLTGLTAKDKVVVTFEKVEEANLTFTDVQPTDWFAEAVDFVVARGLFAGLSETEFGPNVEMSRAMLVTVLYRLSGETSNGDSGFADVPADAWYSAAVAWAKEAGVVSGVSETSFAPNQPITREQMATILYSYANAQVDEDAKAALATFADAGNISSYATVPVSWAVEQGLLSGVGNQTLEPQGVATRAQVATILRQFLKNT